MPSRELSAKNLRNLSKPELEKKLDELKQELFQLRVSKVTNTQNSGVLSNMKKIRAGIARILTIMAENERTEVMKVYKKKRKNLPLDLRPKFTRAWRRRLVAKHANIERPRIAKRNSKYPVRKFAVLA